MFRKIIVGTDSSDEANKAVRVACDLTKHYSSELTIMHVPHAETAAFVVGAMSGYHAAISKPSFEEVEEAGKKVLAEAEAMAADLGCTSVKTFMPHGDAAKEILAHAEHIKADLIVTGRRGLGSVSSLVMGSTSQRIGHHAKCACLSVI